MKLQTKISSLALIIIVFAVILIPMMSSEEAKNSNIILWERTANTETFKNLDTNELTTTYYDYAKFMNINLPDRIPNYVEINSSYFPITPIKDSAYSYKMSYYSFLNRTLKSKTGEIINAADNQFANYKAYFKNNSNTANAVRFEKDGYFFTYDLSGGQVLWAEKTGQPAATDTLGSGAPSNSQDSYIQVDGGKAVYPNAFYNTNVTYELTKNMMKENFVLTGLPSYKDYLYLRYSGTVEFNRSLKVCANGVCYTPSGTQDDFTTSGQIDFRDSNNKTIFYLPAPIIKDSSGKEISGKYRFKGSDAHGIFYLYIGSSFLQSAVYPIFIDPTLTAYDNSTGGKDTFIYNADCSGCFGGTNYSQWAYGAQSYVSVGNRSASGSSGNQTTRSLLYFNLSSYSSQVGAVTSAKLALYHYYSPYGYCLNVSLYNMTSNWNEGSSAGSANSDLNNGSTWFEYAYGDNIWTGAGTNDWNAQGGDFVDSPIATTTIVGGSGYKWYNWTLPSGNVLDWIKNPSNNYGMMMKATNETTFNDECSGVSRNFIDEKRFYSKEYSATYVPYIQMTYSPNINVISPTPSQIFTQNAPTALLNISTYVDMDTCYYNNGSANFTMAKKNSTYFWNDTAGLQYLDGSNHQVTFYCNQSSDGTWVTASAVSFEVDSSNITRCRDLHTSRTYNLINNISSSGSLCLYQLGSSVVINGNFNNATEIEGTALYTDIGSSISINNISLFNTATSSIDNTFEVISANTITITNSIINMFGGNGASWATYFNYAKNISITNTQISANDTVNQGAMYVQAWRNLTFSNNIFNNTIDMEWNNAVGAQPVYLRNNRFVGTGTTIDWLIGSSIGPMIYSINDTFDTLEIYSNLTRQWYFDVFVNDTSGSNVSLATVDFYNRTGSLVASALTGTDGKIPTQTLTQYIQNETTTTYATPYTINVSKAGYTTNSSIINFTSNYQHNVRLSSSDVTPPNLAIVYPTATTYQSVTQLNYTTDATAQTCWYSINSGAANTTITCGQNVTGLSAVSGSNTWKIWANDSLNNINTSSVTFTIDNTAPQITVTSPTATTYKTSSISFNVSSNENLSYCSVSIDNWVTNNTMTINASLRGANYTNSSIPDGSYTARYWCNDSYNNINNTKTVAFSIDTTPPYISVVYPVNNSNYTSVTQLNYTSNGNKCWYSKNGGVTNQTSVTCGTNFTVTSSEGVNNWVVYANDTVGNLNTTYVTFRVDSTKPSLTIYYPVQGTSYNAHNLTLNFSASDSGVGLQTCWKSLNGEANLTIPCNQNNTVNSSVTGTIEGLNTLRLYANDSLGNVANITRTFYVVTTAPAISPDNPENNLWLNYKNNILFNFTAVTSSTLDTCQLWGNWTGTWALNQSVTGVSSGVQTNFNLINLTDGNYIWNIKCNDTSGNSDFHGNNHTVHIDTTYPIIAFNDTSNPADGVNLSQNWLCIYVNYTETNLDYFTFGQWYPGGYNIDTTTLNNDCFAPQIDATYQYNVTICDKAGNCNSTATRTITLDETAPSGTLLYPPDGMHNSSTSYNFTANFTDATSGVKNATLYIYNSSDYLVNQTAKTLSGEKDTIFGTIVTLAEGVYKWFYNLFDFAGNSFTTTNSTLTIDTTKPRITILSPTATTYSSNSITINASANENISQYLYSLNGAANVSFTPSITITAAAGSNTLVICANDTANNVNCTSVSFTVYSASDLTVTLETAPTPDFGTNITLQATATSSNTVSYCNFSLASPTATIFNNVKGTQTGNNWNSTSYVVNETGFFTYNVTCATVFGDKVTAADSVTITYNMSYSPVNYSFAARTTQTEANYFFVYMYDDTSSNVNFSISAAIEDANNFTLSYPNSILLNSVDSATSPSSFNLTINASSSAATGAYDGNITLTNLVNGQISYVYFTYSLNPPSGIAEIRSTLNSKCSNVWGSECSNTIALSQSSSTAIIYKIANIGSYGLTSCTAKGAGDLEGVSWISSETFNLESLYAKVLTINVAPGSTVSPVTYNGYIYISCAAGDALGSSVQTEPSNRPYLRVTVTSAATPPSGGGGETPAPPLNISEITKGICGNRICEAEAGENFQSCPVDCQGNLEPITACFSSDKETRKNCILYQGTAITYILIFIILIIIFTLIFEIRKKGKTYKVLPLTLRRNRR